MEERKWWEAVTGAPPHRPLTLEEARHLHRGGHLDEAEAVYTALLAEATGKDADRVEAGHLLGVIALQRGDLPRAIALIRDALVAAPTARKAYNLGTALQAAGEMVAARVAYGQALQLDPGLIPAHLALGQVLLAGAALSTDANATKAATAALPHFQAAVDADAGNAVARAGLAQALLALGHTEEAVAEWQRAESIGPSDAALLFSLGVSLQAANRLEEAERAYRQSLEIESDDPAVLVNLGAVLLARGDAAAAVACHQRALGLSPDFVLALLNLGAAFQAQGKLSDAVRAYRRALRLDTSNAAAYFNLGTAAQAAGWRKEAEAAYRDAIALEPRHAEAFNNLGLVLEAAGRLPEAVEALHRACRFRAENAAFHNNLANALYLLSRRDRQTAQVHARRWLAEHPDQPIARHMAQALAGTPDLPQAPPPQPAEHYVRTLFQGFASRFDSELLGIGYCGPALMAEAFARVLPQPAGTLDVLDAGCGTGLCGPRLRPWARSLVGVDLAPAMLALAAERGVYDALEAADILPWLATQPGRFDLIAAADVLCYYGDLVPLLSGLAGALRSGTGAGYLALTTEKHDGPEPWRLHPHGRYSHSGEGLTAMLTAAGLVECHRHIANLRNECGHPSWNWVVLARLGSDPNTQKE